MNEATPNLEETLNPKCLRTPIQIETDACTLLAVHAFLPLALKHPEAKAHIAQCSKHPMSQVLAVLERGHAIVLSACSHVSHGGPTRKEAEEWVRKAAAAIAQAKGAESKPADPGGAR